MAQTAINATRRPFHFQNFAEQITQLHNVPSAGFDFLALPSVLIDNNNPFEQPIGSQVPRKAAYPSDYNPRMFGQFDAFESRDIPLPATSQRPRLARGLGTSNKKMMGSHNIPIVEVMPPMSSAKPMQSPLRSMQNGGDLKNILQNVIANNSGINIAATQNAVYSPHLSKGPAAPPEFLLSMQNKNFVSGTPSTRFDPSANRALSALDGTPFKRAPSQIGSKIEPVIVADPTTLMNPTMGAKLGSFANSGLRNTHGAQAPLNNTLHTHLMAKKISEKLLKKNDAKSRHLRS